MFLTNSNLIPNPPINEKKDLYLINTNPNIIDKINKKLILQKKI